MEDITEFKQAKQKYIQLKNKFKSSDISVELDVDLNSEVARALKPLLCEGITVCQGSVEFKPNPVKIGDYVFDSFKTISFETLQKIAKPSGFGHGEETKFDLQVRNAFEISKDFLQQNDWSLLWPSIAERISTELMQNLTFSFIPYKLQIYTKGGHFKAHTDTLHDENHIATLLLRLPVKHTGGVLIVNDDEYDDPWTSENQESDKIDWIAFYTDVPHKVTEVTDGERIVFQLEIYSSDTKGWYTHTPNDDGENDDDLVDYFSENHTFDDDSILNEFTESVVSKKYLSEAKKVIGPNGAGFFLNHMYPKAAMKNANFKGDDLYLCNLLKKMGFQVVGVPATLEAIFDPESHEKEYNLYLWEKPFENYDDLTVYCLEGIEAYSYNLEYKRAIGYTGNESESGELKSLTGVMFAYTTAKKQKIEQ